MDWDTESLGQQGPARQGPSHPPPPARSGIWGPTVLAFVTSLASRLPPSDLAPPLLLQTWPLGEPSLCTLLSLSCRKGREGNRQSQPPEQHPTYVGAIICRDWKDSAPIGLSQSPPSLKPLFLWARPLRGQLKPWERRLGGLGPSTHTVARRRDPGSLVPG